MASKFLQTARQLAAAERGVNKIEDVWFWAERPALEEFMTMTVDDSGQARELSALMVVVDCGKIKCGLRDDDCGGWTWKSGDTVSDALDALERALQDGSARWGGSGHSSRRNGRRK